MGWRLFQFLRKHSEIRLTLNYDLNLHGIVFTMDRYPKRKEIVIDMEACEQLPFYFDLDTAILERLEEMYTELITANEEEK